MSTCEAFEAQVSAWLDRELPRDEEIDLVDHLVRCPDCRHFYVEARALDGALARIRPPRALSAPLPETWSAIESRAGLSRPRRAVPAWALRVAAAAVLMLGLSGLVWMGVQKGSAASAAPPDALIALGEDAGRMTEDRFIELTKEVLRAEPRYRTAMYRVMHQVVQETTPPERLADTEFAGATREVRTVVESRGREPV